MHNSILNVSKTEDFSAGINEFVRKHDCFEKINKYCNSHRVNTFQGYGIQKQNLLDQIVISDFITDIPKNILLELLDESLFVEYENHKYNFNLKNCLASYISDNRLFLFCVKGPCYV